MAAVFLSDLPGSISSAGGMLQEGRSTTYIIAVWSVLAVACTVVSAVLGSVPLGAPS
jgi:hypothetical protein